MRGVAGLFLASRVPNAYNNQTPAKPRVKDPKKTKRAIVGMGGFGVSAACRHDQEEEATSEEQLSPIANDLASGVRFAAAWMGTATA